MGPIGAARVGFVDGEYVLNPQVEDMQKLYEHPAQRLNLYPDDLGMLLLNAEMIATQLEFMAD